MLTACHSIKPDSAGQLGWLILLISLIISDAFANGWEHTSIDFEVLVKALNDPNPNVRMRAAESIGYRQQEGAIDALLARLEKPESVARVRQHIFSAIGMIGDSAALDAVHACLTNETEVAVRAQCAVALGNIDNSRAEQLALQAAQDDNIHVRRQAINSLGSFSGEESIKTLIGFAGETDESIRFPALLSLGRSGSTAATNVLVGSLNQAESRKEMLVALQALTLLANPDTIDSIQKVYENSDDETTKQYALLAMASTQAGKSEVYFLEALASEDFSSQILGLAILRNYGDSSQVEAIVEHAVVETNDLFALEDAELLQRPALTIARLQLINEYLKTVIRLDPEAGGALYLGAATEKSVPRTSSPALKIAQGFYEARWQSIYGLGYVGDAAAAEQVRAALRDPDARIRAVATRSLGVMNDRQNIDLIRQMLVDDSAEVRWTAARVLGRLKATEAVDGLIGSLTDTNAQVRLESALALGYLKAQESRATLAQLAENDADSRVSEAAVYALSLLE